MARALSCDVAGRCPQLGPARDSELGGLFRLGNASPMSRCSSEGKISLSEGVAIGAPGAVAGSFDHLIRPRKERRWDRQAESFGGLEVDDQLKRDGLLNGQVGQLGPFEDLVHIDRSTAEQVAEARRSAMAQPQLVPAPYTQVLK